MIFFWNTKKTSPSANSPINRVILNASTIPLNDTRSTLPNMSTTLLNWFMPIVFGVITKLDSNYEIIETIEEITFRGIWQPFTAQKLSIKPEGQRAWSWFTVHAEMTLILEIDSVILYKNVKHRVMEKLDFQEYGYVEYHLVKDYE
jgi:hypothetical protein